MIMMPAHDYNLQMFLQIYNVEPVNQHIELFYAKREVSDTRSRIGTNLRSIWLAVTGVFQCRMCCHGKAVFEAGRGTGSKKIVISTGFPQIWHQT